MPLTAAESQPTSRAVSRPQPAPRRRRAQRLLTLSLLTVAALVCRAIAQTPSGVTTMSGVYTAAQARRGEETYMSICVACHPLGTYATPAFKSKWSGSTLADLFGLVSETMPQQDPGSLLPEEYAQVIAYILKVNGMPAGETDIPADAAELKRIRIELQTEPKK